MNHLCTISQPKFKHYTYAFCQSARQHGWRDKIDVFTPIGEKFYCNENIIEVDQAKYFDTFNDARWLKSELIHQYKEGDIVLYCDSDILLSKGWQKCFDLLDDKTHMALPTYDFDNVRDLDPVSELTGYQGNIRWSDGHMVFRVCPETLKFFRNYRYLFNTSQKYQNGTMCALNLAVRLSWFPIMEFPEIRHTTTYHRVNCLPFDEKKLWIYHFGGRIGKDEWHELH